MTPIKVLYIVPSVGIGGAETFIKSIAKHHHRNIVQPIFLLFKRGPLSEWLELQKYPVLICQQAPRLSRPWTWLLYHRELKKILQEQKIDIVHSTMAYAGLFSSLAACKNNHIWFQHGPVSGWMDTLAQILPHKTILYNSVHTLREQFKKNLFRKKRNNKDFILDLGTEPYTHRELVTEKKKFRDQFQLTEDTAILMMACRLQRWKGVHVAIDALKILTHKQSSPKMVLIIFGDSRWDLEYAKTLKEQSIGLPVFFESPTLDIKSVFSNADIVINASTRPEPFGLTLIEAMSCGAIPVGPREGGPQEILYPELKECLFSPNNPQDLANTIENTLSIQNRKHIEEKSKHLFIDRFQVDKMILRLEGLYKTLV
jgi:glycosyltransferase involved in cell wall biosynthesis